MRRSTPSASSWAHCKKRSDTLALQLSSLSDSNARRLAEVRQTLEVQLAQLQATNTAKSKQNVQLSMKSWKPRCKRA